jgi:transglutaminase superfamily protein
VFRNHVLCRNFVAVVASVLLAGLATAAEPVTRTIVLEANDAFERGMGAFDVRMNDDRSGVVLYDHVLHEDDGPGIAGHADWIKYEQSPLEKIKGDVRIKKILRIDATDAIEARLYAPRGVQVEINGSPVETDPKSQYPKIPTALLKEGDNEIILSATGDGSAIKVAPTKFILKNAPERAGQPSKSFKSVDGGKTWQPIDGEVMLRVHLIRFRNEGHVISPVVDLLSDPGQPSVVLSGAAAGCVKIALKAKTKTPKGTAVELAWRSGPSPVVDEALWSPWHNGDKGTATEGHRYLQWKATLKTNDGRTTPQVGRVTARATYTPSPAPAWTKGLSVTSHRNQEIRYTSMPFEYEDPNHPKMAALRKNHKLDEVAAGAESELEKMAKIRTWVTVQWRFKNPTTYYPKWDTEDIFTHQIGFCVQYAIAFMQCATSMGVQTRFLFGSNFRQGHEVTEFWSNEYGKWVYMDGSGGYHIVDPQTGVPYSLMEYRDLILETYYGDKPANRQNRPKVKNAKTSPKLHIYCGTDLTPTDSQRRDDGLFPVRTRWMYLRYMTRNNFYAKPRPVPHMQGLNWDCPDYWSWNDHGMTFDYRYRRFTRRRSDIDWTINQVRYDAAAGSKPGTVTVQMGTVTPYFDTFLIKTDQGPWRPMGRTFAWKLHPGTNRLAMRIRNTSGVKGIVSHLELNYAPQK